MNLKTVKTGDRLTEKSKLKNSTQNKLLKPQLRIDRLSVFTYLGCSSQERSVLQEVYLSIEMAFPKTPLGEKTDRLGDTLCYEAVCTILRNFIKNRQFHLIEKMARDCLSILKKTYPFMRIQLTLYKKSPPVEGLKGEVTYTCGDIF